MILQIALPLIMLCLAVYIIDEDIRHLEIPAFPVLLLALMMTVYGIAFPAGDLRWQTAVAGGLMGLGIGGLTRLLVYLRTGAAAFGGADIALMTGAGALVGPYLFGPWMLALAGIGLALSFLPSMQQQSEINGKMLRVTPLCPAILLSAAVFGTLAHTGMIPTHPLM